MCDVGLAFTLRFAFALAFTFTFAIVKRLASTLPLNVPPRPEAGESAVAYDSYSMSAK